MGIHHEKNLSQIERQILRYIRKKGRPIAPRKLYEVKRWTANRCERWAAVWHLIDLGYLELTPRLFIRLGKIKPFTTAL